MPAAMRRAVAATSVCTATTVYVGKRSVAGTKHCYRWQSLYPSQYHEAE